MNRKLKLLGALAIVSMALAGVAQGASSPTVATGSTSSITSSSAVLHGTVNPGGATTTYQFQWGLTTAYGLASTTKSTSGTKNVAVKVTASNLLPGTVYHYRLVATNRFGSAAVTDHRFKTAGNPPPTAATGPAVHVSTTSATVSGVINPHGQKTTWVFQYGLTATYGSETFGGSVPAGSAPVIVAQTLTGLAPGAVFHYRIVAFHGSSVVAAGIDQVFITEPSPRPVPRITYKTSPHRDSKRPYTFTTSGKVNASSRFPSSLECLGDVSVRLLLGKHTVSSNQVPVTSACTFSSQATFAHLPGRGKRPKHEQLKVQVTFHGNAYVAPASGHEGSVRLG